VFDYSYDGVMRSFEDSLQRLGINSIDLLLIHDLDAWSHRSPANVDAYFGELATSGWRALEELRDSGAIKGIGAGLNIKEAIPRFLDLFDIDFFLLAIALHPARAGRARQHIPALRRTRRRRHCRRRL
jgi:D-threo-aldose 1-dehydrogenase